MTSGDAHVRVSKDLCSDEQQFLDKRRKHTTTALAQYLDVPESEINPDDVPISKFLRSSPSRGNLGCGWLFRRIYANYMLLFQLAYVVQVVVCVH